MASKFGKWLKKAVPFIAGVAIGIFAAPIAAAVGLTSTVGAFAGQAIVGAGIGGVVGGVAGYDPLEAAALGAGAGVIGGLFQGQPGAPGAGQATTGAPGVAPAGAPAPALTAGTTAAPGGLVTQSQIAAASSPAPALTGTWGQRTAQAFKGNVTDPQKAADFALRLGANGVAYALANTLFADPAEKAAYEQYGAYLEESRAREGQIFNIQLKEAQAFLDQANQIDPTHVAQQAANQQTVRDGNTLNELRRSSALRGDSLSGGDETRAALGVSRNAGTAYDSGYNSGLDRKLSLQETGLSSLPTSGGLAGAFGTQATNIGSAADTRQKERSNIVQTFGIFGGDSEADIARKERDLGYSTT